VSWHSSAMLGILCMAIRLFSESLESVADECVAGASMKWRIDATAIIDGAGVVLGRYTASAWPFCKEAMADS